MAANGYVTTTPESIDSIKTLETTVTELHKDLLNAANALINTYDENKDGLGYFNDDIKTLLEALAADSNDSQKVKKLTRRLELRRKLIQEYLSSNPYASANGGRGFG